MIFAFSHLIKPGNFFVYPCTQFVFHTNLFYLKHLLYIVAKYNKKIPPKKYL